MNKENVSRFLLFLLGWRNASPQTPSTEKKTCDGYTLFGVFPLYQEGGDFPLLIDMEGKEVKRWIAIPFPVKMIPGGSIIVPSGAYSKINDVTHVSQLSWNGSIEWDFCQWEQDDHGQSMARQHHDFQREGNAVGYYAPSQAFTPYGSTLILAHKHVFHPNVSRRPLIDDVIYEARWDGTMAGFEWHASDHIDEMGFDAKTRMGIRLNPGGPGLILKGVTGDWLHIDSISVLGNNKWYEQGDERFNPNNIMICSRHTNFIAIVNKKNGTIVWRYGPDFPRKHDRSNVGRFIGPHDAHIIQKGLPGEGNILIFDNGGVSGYGVFGLPDQVRFYSRVVEFNPITFRIIQQYTHKKGLYLKPRKGKNHRFFSMTMSSVQRLPNGNTLISEALSGRIFEITPTNDIVWDYVYPNPRYVLYKAYRVPPEWVPGNPAGYPFWGK
jgi:hypothetical protein